MKYNPDIHHRRSIRLKGYDYSQAGAYFVTIVTYKRQFLFGEIVNGKIKLNDGGKIAEQCWNDIPKHFPNAIMDEFVIMPNHIHGIIILNDNGSIVGAKNFSPQQNTLSGIKLN
jgi:REP element-mobilizing transposase RayT